MTRGKYHKMATLKKTVKGSGNEKPMISYRPFITGAKGQSHDDIVAEAPNHGVELGELDENYHYGSHPANEQNELHGGPVNKCIRGCMDASPKVSNVSAKHTNSIILATPAIDTRQGSGIPEIGNLRYYSLVHIRDVQHLMLKVVNFMLSDVLTHDWTKIEETDKFLDNFVKTGEGKEFKQQEWWKLHAANERHHPMDYTGEGKPMLPDIIHMLCDWVAAGNARSDKGVSIADSLKRLVMKEDKFKDFLYDCFKNTFEWINADISVEHKHQIGVSEVKDFDESTPKTIVQEEKSSPEPAKTESSEDDVAKYVDTINKDSEVKALLNPATENDKED